jgi:nucleoside-diphosphate-sugar epimerase
MALHVVAGAGPVGSAIATLLAEQGHDVRVLTRSGSGPDQPHIEKIRLDATSAPSLSKATEGAVALYNCVNPPYTQWATDWPPLTASFLAAAEAARAVLVTISNLYGYGPVDHAMRESDPLAATSAKGRARAQGWKDTLAAHQAGRVVATELRSSDYFGPGVLESSMGERVIPNVLGGKPVHALGDVDAPHSWTYAPDVARTAIALATDERAWGKPWHAPSNAPLSQRAIIDALCSAANVAPVKVRALPRLVLTLAGMVVPIMHELREIRYQFERPFVVDSSAATATFGIEPTPMGEALASTIAWYRSEAGRSESRENTHIAVAS